MSMVNSETVVCPTCGQTTTATIWSSLNTNIDTEAKERLLKGTLLTSVCPKCGAKNALHYPMLYHDPDKKLMVYLAPTAEDRKEVEQTFGSKNSIASAFVGYTYRIVTSPDEMREKAIIAECGMDDRVVEVLKLVILGLAESEISDLNASAVWFYTKDQRFFIQILGTHPCTTEVYWEDYYKIKELIKGELASDKEYYINHAWAKRVWKRIGSVSETKETDSDHKPIEESKKPVKTVEEQETKDSSMIEPEQNVEIKVKLFRKGIDKKAKVLIIVVAAIALIAIVLAGLYFWPFSKSNYKIKQATESVVKVYCYDYYGNLTVTGSGFFFYDDKTVVTNYSIMQEAYTCKISTDQDITYNATEFIGFSEERNIAIIQLEQGTGLKPLKLGDPIAVKKGETVTAIGNHLGKGNDISQGVLSGRRPENNMDVLCVTALISRLSNGGALFDEKGRVIGVTYALFEDNQNLNLAIPSNEVKWVYEKMKRNGQINILFLEKYPLYKYLPGYANAKEVGISELKDNPYKYDDKLIRVEGIISHVDGSDCYISLKNERYNSGYGALYEEVNFEHTSTVKVSVYIIDECIPDSLSVGDEVVVYGEFQYRPVGEKYHTYVVGEGDNLFKKVEITATISYGCIYPNLIHYIYE